MINKQTAQDKIAKLVTRFEDQYQSYKHSDYNETLTRRDFIDPFFKALGWDIDNEAGYAEAYREVIHEDKVKVSGATKAPDYSFRLVGGKRLFFVEAKKPSVSVKDEIQPAYQVRRYGWSAKMPISIITDFEEFSIYDCTKKPKPEDKAAVARIKYLSFRDYIKEFDFLWDTFSKEQVLKGSFDKFLLSDTHKKGTATVDKDFLESLDRWRTYLAVNISWNNRTLDEDEINFVVQQTIDRVIFLRIAEDRSVEPYGTLKNAVKQGNLYQNLFELFQRADEKYNSGLFDFKKDKISRNVVIENKIIRTIINELYYPECPYEFSVLSVEILGSAYEQFLGKVIRITPAHHAKIEEKPEVRKAGGVYYTPQYIVDYIAKNTVGKLIEGKTPKEISKIKILDPACGSGSFLIGAFQYLLDYHKDYYSENGKPSKGKKDNPLTPDGHLTTAEKKRILLNNIFGVDLDTNAVEVTKLSLLLKCLEGETEASIKQQLSIWNERVLPTLENNIKSGNSLISTNYYEGKFDFGEERKVKPFHWQNSYTEIMKLGGFDVVIGNPPYGATFSTSEKEYLMSNYQVAEGNYESFAFFIECAYSILKPDGLIGYIIPDTWFTIKSAYKLRKFILNNFSLEEIQILNEKVFKTVKVDVCTIILKKNTIDNRFNVLIYHKDADELNIMKMKFLQKNSFFKKDFEKNEDLNFNFKQDPKSESLRLKIKGQKFKLEDFCIIGSGCKPYEIGKGTPPQTKTMVDEKVYSSKTRVDKTYRLLIRGADISRYSSIQKDNEWLSYGDWLAAPRNKELFNNPRILVQSIRNPKLQRRLIGTYVDDKSVNNNSVTNIILKDKTCSLKLFLGIINSDLMNWYFAVSYNIVNIDPRYIKAIPLPDILNSLKNNKPIENITSAVDKLLDLNKELSTTRLPDKRDQILSKINFFENLINDSVFELYNLIDKEKNIIK